MRFKAARALLMPSTLGLLFACGGGSDSPDPLPAEPAEGALLEPSSSSRERESLAAESGEVEMNATIDKAKRICWDDGPVFCCGPVSGGQICCWYEGTAYCG